MKSAILSLAILASASTLVERVTRETNSNASVKRGIDHYAGERFTDAESAFRDAAAISPNATTAFDLGTAQIAAGKYAEGSATLGKALEDSRVRAEAYYNRGNSALAANALDHAIADYIDALRIRSDDFEAKRNLEIALQKKAAQQQRSGGPESQQEGDGEERNRAETPEPSEQRGGNEQQSVESILRSVEQQEREELNRMRRSRAGARTIGW